MVGDGMQCPPSPLLFDPSVTLDPSLRDMAEAPIDILALEEPDRGSSSTPLVPPAEGSAQVGLEGLPPPPPSGGFFSSKPPLFLPPCPGGSSFTQLGCAHGLDGIRSARVGVAARCGPRGGSVGGSVPPLSWGWMSWECLGHQGCLPAIETSLSQLGGEGV